MHITSSVSLLKYSIKLLPNRDRRLLAVASLLQVFLSFLDLAGVAIIGVLGSLSVNGVQSREPGNRVSSVIKFLNLDGQTFQYQAAFLGILAATLLMTRTFLSVLFSRRIMHFLGQRGASISSQLIAKLLNQNYLEVNSRSVQETIFAITSGVSVLTLVILGGILNLITDFSLLIVLTAGLLVVDFKLAIGTFVMFGCSVLILYFVLHRRVHLLGLRQTDVNIGINEKIEQIVTSYRENFVRGRRSYYAKKISSEQHSLASIHAELSFIPNISKYVVEASLVFGTLIICAVQFNLQGATQAIGTLSIFLAAASRIAPASLRIQQSALAFKSAGGSLRPTIELIDSLVTTSGISLNPVVTDFDYQDFFSDIELENLSLTYPNSHKPALENISLKINSGETIAIVGPSGSGKTTLVDAILGVLRPTSGKVLISGTTPENAIKAWPGAVAYVPQDVVISSKTILENITIGFDLDSIRRDLVNRAVEISELTNFVETLPHGLDTLVGERGTKISGGQRQRLGIARALYTNPKLLVLDEATSALDGQTEADISSSLQEMRGSVTLLIIAHRLSTVLNADRIYYLEEGRIIAQGSFLEVRKLVPNFDAQARLMGL